jgi:hypothetical protein
LDNKYPFIAVILLATALSPRVWAGDDVMSGSDVHGSTVIGKAGTVIIQPPHHSKIKKKSALSCLWINNGMTGNQCDESVMLTEFTAVNLAYGNQVVFPCIEASCIYSPNSSSWLLSPYGFQTIRILKAKYYK